MRTTNSDAVAQDQIRAFVERIERMNEERKAIADDLKEIYAEAKGNGFDVKALKIVVRRREQDRSERYELEALVELYEAALGMRTAPDDYDDDEPRAPAPARAREIIEEFDADPDDLGPIETRTYTEPATLHPPAAADPGEDDGLNNTSSPDTISAAPTQRSNPPSPAAEGGEESGLAATNSEPSMGSPAAGEAADAASSAARWTRPHDGPVSSSGVPRYKHCENPDHCGAASWRTGCPKCRLSAPIAVEAGGQGIEHEGYVS